MSKSTAILTSSQWKGVVLLLILLAGVFLGLHFLPQPSEEPPAKSDTLEKKIVDNKKHYYDSLYSARMVYYDSLRLVRRDSLKQVYEAHRDSVSRVDSIWWDSVYNSRPHAIKRDTILELNSADTTELKLIRGIGSSTAKRIVRYREQLGGYTHVGQLQDDGLYMDKYGHSIRSKFCLPDSILSSFTVCTDSVHPIPVNHASIERLQHHPYISHTLAKEIYSYRRQHVRIQQIEDIQDLPHMSDSLCKRLTPYLSFEP